MIEDAEVSHSKKSIWKFAVIPLLGFFTLVAWGLSSPVGSSPDDNFHLVSIWCGQGVREGYCETVDNAPEVRSVPMWVSGAACFAYNPEASAKCQTKDFGEPTQMVTVDYGNYHGIYPPVFYWIMSLFTGPNTEISVMVMRILNSALFVGMVTLTYRLVPLRFKRPLLWGSVLTAVPLAMFVIPSTNPSSWAVTSAATLWALLCGLMLAQTKKRRLTFGILVILMALVGAGSRADSALFCLISIGIALLLTYDKKIKISLFTIAVIILVVALSAGMYLTAGQTTAATTGLGDPADLSLRAKAYLTVVNLLQVPIIWPGILGSWGLGWLDTAMPNIVPVASLAAFTGVAFWGLGLSQKTRLDSWRKMVSVFLLLLVLWIFPTFVLVQTGAMAGGYFQPRYILPIAIIFLSVILLGERDQKNPVLSRSQSLAVVLALTISNAFAIHANIRRYVTGVDIQSWNLNSHLEWWWKLPIEPMTVFAIGGLSFALVCVLTFMSGNVAKQKSQLSSPSRVS